MYNLLIKILSLFSQSFCLFTYQLSSAKVPGCHGNLAAGTRPVLNFSRLIDPQLNGVAVCEKSLWENLFRWIYADLPLGCRFFLRHSVCIRRVGHGSLFLWPNATQDFPDPTRPGACQWICDPTRPSRDRPMKSIVNLFCVQRIM